MKSMGTEKKRKQTLHKILWTIESATNKGLAVLEKNLEAEICILEGVTRKKAAEYIEILIDSGKVEKRDDGIWFKQPPY